jgi:GC-rich sequence DNA-binding factor
MHSNEKAMITENLNASRDAMLNLKMNKPKLDDQYTFYQEMKSYLTDIVDCFNEKMQELEKIEANLLSLREKHSQKLQTRHQKDVQDENTENLVSVNSLATYSVVSDGVGAKRYTDAVHQRRSNDRENRRFFLYCFDC